VAAALRQERRRAGPRRAVAPEEAEVSCVLSIVERCAGPKAH
jgi:hypothetical protein